MTTPSWDAEQVANANTIIQVGNQLGASPRDITIALMTAMQESGLKNINYGDAAGPDSLGLFQQRAPWGSAQARMDPAEAARMFFEGGTTGEPGLFSFTNRNSMSLTQAAQAVQVSAFPTAYAKWQGAAESLLGQAPGSQTGAATQGPVAQTPTAQSQLANVSGSALASAGLNSQNDQVQGESVLGAPNPATDSLKDQGNATALQTESQSLNSTETSVTQGEKSVLGGQGSVLDAAASGMTGGTGASGASGGATGATGEAPSSPAAMQANVDSQFLQPMTLGEFTKQMGGQALPGSLLSNVPSAVGATGSRGLIIQKAMAQLGTPYVWGGTSPGGFDCSGLVQWAYAQAGINLPRISYAQASSGVRTPISQLQPGDLVAFDENNRNGPGMADHISIYLGNNQILEAPHTGADVRVRTLGPGDETNAWGVSMSSYFGGGSSGSSTGG